MLLFSDSDTLTVQRKCHPARISWRFRTRSTRVGWKLAQEVAAWRTRQARVPKTWIRRPERCCRQRAGTKGGRYRGGFFL